jgi:hypothetical protein
MNNSYSWNVRERAGLLMYVFVAKVNSFFQKLQYERIKFSCSAHCCYHCCCNLRMRLYFNVVVWWWWWCWWWYPTAYCPRDFIEEDLGRKDRFCWQAFTQRAYTYDGAMETCQSLSVNGRFLVIDSATKRERLASALSARFPTSNNNFHLSRSQQKRTVK